MNLDDTTQTVAAMFADMADIFSDAVDADGLHMLLTYCLDTAGVQHGKIVLETSDSASPIVVTHNAPSRLNTTWSLDLVERAQFTLQPEVRLVQQDEQLIGEYVFPMRVRGTSIGFIQLFSLRETPLHEHTLAVLQSIADIAATTIDQTHRIQQAYLLVNQLQGALDSRVIIEQAKGVLAEREKVDFSQAFGEIRSIARREQRPVRSVAADIVATHHCVVSMNNSTSHRIASTRKSTSA